MRGKLYIDQYPGLHEELVKRVNLEDARYLTRGERKAIIRRRQKNAREAFLRSPEWKAIREEVFARDGRRCKKCESTERLCIDHILPRSKFPELELERTNLRVLCWPCNKAKGVKIEAQP